MRSPHSIGTPEIGSSSSSICQNCNHSLVILIEDIVWELTNRYSRSWRMQAIRPSRVWNSDAQVNGLDGFLIISLSRNVWAEFLCRARWSGRTQSQNKNRWAKKNQPCEIVGWRMLLWSCLEDPPCSWDVDRWWMLYFGSSGWSRGFPCADVDCQRHGHSHEDIVLECWCSRWQPGYHQKWVNQQSHDAPCLVSDADLISFCADLVLGHDLEVGKLVCPFVEFHFQVAEHNDWRSKLQQGLCLIKPRLENGCRCGNSTHECLCRNVKKLNGLAVKHNISETALEVKLVVFDFGIGFGLEMLGLCSTGLESFLECQSFLYKVCSTITEMRDLEWTSFFWILAINLLSLYVALYLRLGTTWKTQDCYVKSGFVRLRWQRNW